MRANISKELYDLMDEKIYLDLECHILNNKIIQAEKDKKKEGFRNYLDQLLKRLLNERLEVIKQLRDNNIKLFEAEKVDDGVDDTMFVEYKFYQKTNGGYKEGDLRYWRAALKLKLNRRMKEYFVKDGVNE